MERKKFSVNAKALAVAAIVVVALGSVAVWAMRPGKPPEAAASDPAELAKFVRTEQFNDLPEAAKRPYMKTLRKNMPQIVEARNQGRISQNDYEAAYLNAYMERKLDQMEEFYEVPEANRAKVLLADYTKKEKASKSGAASKPASATTPPAPDEEKEEEFVEDRVETWPPEEQAKWETFRKAVKEAKQAAKGKK